VLDEGRMNRSDLNKFKFRKWTNDELGDGTHVLVHVMVVESKQNCRDRSKILGQDHSGGDTSINGRFLGGLLLLLFVALAADRGGQQGLDLFALDLKVGFVLRGIEGKPSDLQWAVWHEKSGEFELRNNVLFLLKEDGEGSDKTVVDTLVNTHLGFFLVIKSSEVEAHSVELLLDFREDSSGSLHLELINLVWLSFIDSCSDIHISRFTVTSRDEHVDGVNFVDIEFTLFVFKSLLLSWVLDDRLFAVDGVLFHLVREHTFNSSAVV